MVFSIQLIDYLYLLIQTIYLNRANFNANTQLSCNVKRYLSGLFDETFNTSIKLCSIPTANQSPPVGQ